MIQSLKKLIRGWNPTLDSGNGAAEDLHSTNNALHISGPAAEDAAVSGNPVLFGGRYDTVDRSLDDGDVGALALDQKGRLRTLSDDVLGTTADAAVDTDAAGSISAKLRGLVKLVMARIPVLGSAAKAASSPVTLATDDALYDRIGEVADSPAANTLLARLKDIVTSTLTTQADTSLNVARLSAAGIVNAGGIEVSTGNAYQNSNFNAPTTAFFDGTDAGFTSGQRFIRVPWAPGQSYRFRNTMNASVTVSLRLSDEGNVADGIDYPVVYSETLGNATRVFVPTDLGGETASEIIGLPALAVPTRYVIIQLFTATDPTTNGIMLQVSRQ